jgi:predicted amidophosphoribosyltransferase
MIQSLWHSDCINFGMANKITVNCGESSLDDLVLCAHCQDVTTTSRGFCLRCGEPCVFSLKDALNGRFDELPAILEDTGVTWIASILNQLLVSRHGASRAVGSINPAA